MAEFKAGKITTQTPGNLLNHSVIPAFSRPLADLDEQELKEVQRRRSYLEGIYQFGKPVFMAEYLNPLIQQVALAINDPSPPSSITVYRWHKKIQFNSDLRQLIRRYDRRGPRTFRQSELLMELTAIVIVERFYKTRQINVEKIYVALKGRVKAENAKRLPHDLIMLYSSRTLHRIIAKADMYEVAVLREGKVAAARKFKLVMEGVKTSRILERVEIDHTPLDLFLIDDETMLPLGRPTLTVVIDHYSRVLIGYYISFDSPSTVAVMAALRHAILPKELAKEALPNLKINNQWPCYGLIELVAVDNGFEFHSDGLESVALDLGFKILYCPKKQPWYKGRVERFLRTVNYSFANQFPGASYAKYYQRGDYDPLKCAMLTMTEFKHAFEKWVVDIYHQDLHKGIGVSPISRWRESAAQYEPMLPASLEDFDTRIGLVDERTLQNYGIRLNHINYNSEALRPIINAYGTGITVRVSYNPENLGRILVWGPEQPESVSVEAVNFVYANSLTLKQNELIREQLRQKGKETVNDEEVMQAKYDLMMSTRELMYSPKLKHRKKGGVIAGITSVRPEGSDLLVQATQAKQKTKKSKPKPLPKPRVEQPSELPPLLPSFTMKKDEEK